MAASIKASGAWSHAGEISTILHSGRVFLTQQYMSSFGTYGPESTAMVMDTSMNALTVDFTDYPDASSEVYYSPIGCDGTTDYVLRMFTDDTTVARVQLWSITDGGAATQHDEWTYSDGAGVPGQILSSGLNALTDWSWTNEPQAANSQTIAFRIDTTELSLIPDSNLTLVYMREGGISPGDLLSVGLAPDSLNVTTSPYSAVYIDTITMPAGQDLGYVKAVSVVSSGPNAGDQFDVVSWNTIDPDGAREVVMGGPLSLNSSKVGVASYSYQNPIPEDVIRDWLFTRSGTSLTVTELTGTPGMTVESSNGPYEVHLEYYGRSGLNAWFAVSARHDGPLSFWNYGEVLMTFDTTTNTASRVNMSAYGPKWADDSLVYEDDGYWRIIDPYLYGSTDADKSSIYTMYKEGYDDNQLIIKWTHGQRAIFTHAIDSPFQARVGGLVAWHPKLDYGSTNTYKLDYVDKASPSQVEQSVVFNDPSPDALTPVTLDVLTEEPALPFYPDDFYVLPWHRGVLLILQGYTVVADYETTPRTRWFYIEDSLIEPPLRMQQRDDGLGPNGHARIILGGQAASIQSGNRIPGRSTYS